MSNTKCEKCGCEMNVIKEGLSIGMTCPNCGWGWAAANTEHILLDEQLYTIKINGNLVPANNEMRFVAKHTGCNYIEARKRLQQSDFEISCKAVDIQKLARELKEAGISFVITPDFPYELFDGVYKNGR